MARGWANTMTAKIEETGVDEWAVMGFILTQDGFSKRQTCTRLQDAKLKTWKIVRRAYNICFVEQRMHPWFVDRSTRSSRLNKKSTRSSRWSSVYEKVKEIWQDFPLAARNAYQHVANILVVLMVYSSYSHHFPEQKYEPGNATGRKVVPRENRRFLLLLPLFCWWCCLKQ